MKELIHMNRVAIKPLVALIFIVYSVMLLYWMFVGFGRTHYGNYEYHYNLIPLKTLKMYFTYADKFTPRLWYVNVVGNVAVFAPFGIALPYLFRLRLFRFSLVFAAVLLLLELLQLLLQRGTFDIDDVILNMAGAWIGFAIYRLGRSV